MLNKSTPMEYKGQIWHAACVMDRFFSQFEAGDIAIQIILAYSEVSKIQDASDSSHFPQIVESSLGLVYCPLCGEELM